MHPQSAAAIKEPSWSCCIVVSPLRPAPPTTKSHYSTTPSSSLALCNRSGSFATLAAIRRDSSLVSSLAADRRLGLLLVFRCGRSRRRPTVAPRILRLLIGNVFRRCFVIVVDLLLPLSFHRRRPIIGSITDVVDDLDIWADALPLSRANAAASNMGLIHRPLVNLFRAADMTLGCISYVASLRQRRRPLKLCCARNCASALSQSPMMRAR
jgi:hypothetical protein